jgi:hypothetical protein
MQTQVSASTGTNTFVNAPAGSVLATADASVRAEARATDFLA